MTPEEVMRGDHIEATSVVVYDCDGYFVGPSIAEKLARDGKQVVLVTSHDTIAPYMHFTLESRRMQELLIGLGVTLIAHHSVSEVFPDEVRGYNIYARDAAVSWSADAVVFVRALALRAEGDSVCRSFRGRLSAPAMRWPGGGAGLVPAKIVDVRCGAVVFVRVFFQDR